jgi:hypothetical protein
MKETEQMTEQAQADQPGLDTSKPKQRRTALELAQDRKAREESRIKLLQAQDKVKVVYKDLPNRVKDAIASKNRAEALNAVNSLGAAYEELIDIHLPPL